MELRVIDIEIEIRKLESLNYSLNITSITLNSKNIRENIISIKITKPAHRKFFRKMPHRLPRGTGGCAVRNLRGIEECRVKHPAAVLSAASGALRPSRDRQQKQQQNTSKMEGIITGPV